MTDVYLDEKYLGTVEHARDFMKSFIEERRKQKLQNTLNVI